jgi:hypothetical protein
MSTIWTLLRATAVVGGSSAALLMGGLMGTAHADPVPPAPAPNIPQQLVTSAAGAPQVLQNFATAIGGQPATPPPLASIRVPQPGETGLPGATSALPGATSLFPGAAAPAATSATPGLGIPGLTPTVPAATSATPGLGIPGLTPTAPAATTGPAGLLPQAQLNLPQMPFLPVPLPQQISLPGDLTSLMTGGVPASPGISSPGLVPVAPAAAPVTAPNPLLFPVSGLP